MPNFQNKFVEADITLNEKEKLWVEVLQDLLKDDQKLAEYTSIGLKRAEDFSLDSIILTWKELIDKSLKYDNMRTQC